MLHFARKGVKLSFLPLANWFGADQIERETETVKKVDLSVLQNETGWDRVKRIFQVDEFGNISLEANTILQVSAMSMFVGAIYGGIINSRTAYLEFMKNNEATSFKSHLDAKKTLQDKVTVSFGKGAFKWGWRLTLFCTSFVGISTTIQTYRGKSGVIEYVAAGGISGFLYKFNMGPRGWVVGAGLGSVLGLACGGLTLGLLKLTGLSLEEARYWQYHWKDSRSEYFRKGVADYLEKEDLAVIKLHNDKIGESGKSLDNLDNKDKNVSVTDKNNK